MPQAHHGISRLPETDGSKPARKRFKAYPIGYFHIDIAEVRTEQGKLHLFVAIDRTSKFAFAQLHERATTRIAADFLRALPQAVPYRVHTVLTDNGQHFTTPATSPLPHHSSARPWTAARSSAPIPSNSPAPRTASSAASPSPITRGPNI